MATLLETLSKKVESLGVGEIQHLHNYLNTSSYTGNSAQVTHSAQVILSDPRAYKSLFCLDNLGIDKTLQSVVVEVKNSTLLIYYILDSSCFFIEFTCNYQTLELLRELPTEIVHYLRILCSKKGKLEIIVVERLSDTSPSRRENTLYLLFEDTFPSKMSAKERKEKEVDKYVLSIPLNEISELDAQVVELSYKLGYSSEYISLPIGSDIPNLPINLETITDPYKKEPIEYWGSVVNTEKGEFTVVDTSGFNTTLVICPVEVGRQQYSLNKEAVEKQIDIDDPSDDELELLLEGEVSLNSSTNDFMGTTEDE